MDPWLRTSRRFGGVSRFTLITAPRKERHLPTRHRVCSATMDTLIGMNHKDLRQLPPEKLRQLKRQVESFIELQEGKQETKLPARANKNRPREVSTKRPERRQVKKVVRRDPRFEDSSGKLNIEEFEQEYDFLDEIHEKEKKVLARQIRREKDETQKQELLKLQQRLKNQDRAKKDKAEEKKIKDSLAQEQLEKTGIPHINKSKIKAAKLVQKFKELKKSGKLDKYLEKKRKKNASKERRKLI